MAKTNKLFRYFLKLDPKKYKDISLWLQSSYQNADPDIITLWEYLLKNPPKDEETIIDNQLFFEQVFPQQSFNDARLRNTMTNLMKQWVSYWKYQWSISTPLGDLEFANDLSFNNPYLIEDMAPILNKVEKELSDVKEYSLDYLYAWYLLRKTQIYGSIVSSKSGLQSVMLRLAESIEALDEFYFTAQLKHHLFLTLNSYHLNQTKESFIIETKELLNYLQNKAAILEKNPLLKMYYLLVKTCFSKEEADLDDLLSLYNEKVFTEFSANDLVQITACIPNIIQLNKASDRDKRGLDFLVNELELKITFEKGKTGYIRSNRFINVIRKGIDIYSINWVENFIKEKKEHIEPEYRDSTLLLAKSLIELYKGNYRKATSALIMFTVNDNLILSINFHTFKLMIMYKIAEKEEDSLNELLNAAKSFQTFIKNDSTSGHSAKTDRSTFISIITDLAKTPYHKKNKLEKLHEFCTKQNTIEKRWLLNEIGLKIAQV